MLRKTKEWSRVMSPNVLLQYNKNVTLLMDAFKGHLLEKGCLQSSEKSFQYFKESFQERQFKMFSLILNQQ